MMDGAAQLRGTSRPELGCFEGVREGERATSLSVADLADWYTLYTLRWNVLLDQLWTFQEGIVKELDEKGSRRDGRSPGGEVRQPSEV